MVSVTDGVRHAEVRKILLRSFTREALTAAGTRIRSAARRLVREAVSRGRCDFARDVAAHVPLVAICDLLGVPEADRPHILGLTSSAVSSEQAQHTAQDAWRAKNDILFYFAELAERRRDDPLADLVSVLVTSRVNGRPLDLDEVIFNCYSLVLGGDETTRLAIVGGVLALIEHPGQWRALREGEVDIDTAVEEVLRWTTPSMHQGRAAVEELTIGGATIRPGELVVLWNVSANRDERVFDRPGRFELTRSPNRHLTFAVGPHYCLGAQLARIEIAAVLEALRDFAGEIEPAGPPTRIYSNFLSGLSSLPVLLRPR
jgi:cytochrome P450